MAGEMFCRGHLQYNIRALRFCLENHLLNNFWYAFDSPLDNETGKDHPESAPEGPNSTVKDVGSLVDTVSQSNEEKCAIDGSPCTGPPAKSSMTLEGPAYHFKSSSPPLNMLKRKAGKDKVAFLSVTDPSPSTANKLDSGVKLTDKVDEQNRFAYWWK